MCDVSIAHTQRSLIKINNGTVAALLWRHQRNQTLVWKFIMFSQAITAAATVSRSLLQYRQTWDDGPLMDVIILNWGQCSVVMNAAECERLSESTEVTHEDRETCSADITSSSIVTQEVTTSSLWRMWKYSLQFDRSVGTRAADTYVRMVRRLFWFAAVNLNKSWKTSPQ